MHRAQRFMDVFAPEVLKLEHYWGRVEVALGRRSIHLHILGIAREKSYLCNFYKAKTEKRKVKLI